MEDDKPAARHHQASGAPLDTQGDDDPHRMGEVAVEPSTF